MQKLSIIIPCYNEQNTILPLLRRITSLTLPVEYEIIVVDDGSKDLSWERICSFEEKYSSIKTLRHPLNKGKGAAIKTGITIAAGDYILIQDADLEYNPLDIPKMVSFAIENEVLAVYGSRNLLKQRRYSNIYYLGGVFLSKLGNILYRQDLTDISTGYKLFNTSFLNEPLQEKGFGFCYEITAKIAKHGIKIVEIPIEYSPRTKKEGKKITFFDGIQAVGVLIKNLLLRS